MGQREGDVQHDMRIRVDIVRGDRLPLRRPISESFLARGRPPNRVRTPVGSRAAGITTASTPTRTSRQHTACWATVGCWRPSATTLMTGLHAGRLGVGGWIASLAFALPPETSESRIGWNSHPSLRTAEIFEHVGSGRFHGGAGPSTRRSVAKITHCRDRKTSGQKEDLLNVLAGLFLEFAARHPALHGHLKD